MSVAVRIPLSATSTPQSSEHLGEVVETSTTEYLAQCFAPDDLRFPTMPALGSWVTAVDEEADHVIYGVVSHTTTLPIDAIHRARPLGLSLQELQEQQPQIFAMLRTEFRVTIVGFEPLDRRGSLLPPYQYLPPRPPQIHQG
ncbi:MAG: HAS-barrel domain-containing protein, partial [Cyanobacteria bacterium J06597_1]